MACFAAIGGHEIQVDGRKLVGSALRRGRRAFLQHGSILTGPEHMMLAELLAAAGSPEESASLLQRERAALRDHTTHLTALGVTALDAERFAESFAAALALRAGVPALRVAGCAALLPERLLGT
jgi:lipoate-protein ligase A